MVSAPAFSAAPALASAPALPSATPAQRARIDKTAKGFEASFVSIMLGEMFQGVDPEAPFSGGAGEGAFRSFMTEAMAKSMTARGGLGLSRAVAKEMLKMQGLS